MLSVSVGYALLQVMPKASELKSGMVVEIDGKPYIVRHVQAHNPTARGASTLYKARLNHAQTGQKLDQSFKGDEMLAEVDFRRRNVQFLFQDTDGYTFMDTEDYSQFTLSAEQLENCTPFLIDNAEGYTALIIEDVCVGIDPPGTVELTITETAPALKGSSQSARSKTALLESGLEIQVPEYLAEGEVIKINTSTREFLSRA
ncbi:MAG: elongation factor P-like protein EfpL [Oceanococcus sp.]